MSLISKIRDHSKLLVGILVVTMLGFAAEEFIFYLAKKDQAKSQEEQIVAQVGREKIPLNKFLYEVDRIKYNFQAHYKFPMPDFFVKIYENNILDDLIDEIIYEKVQNYGFKVGQDEMIDLIQGEHIHKEIKDYFKDPKTGEFSKEKLLERMTEIAQNPEQQAGWNNFERSIAKLRLKEKVQNLLNSAAYLNTLDLKWEWDVEKTKVDVKYLFFPYEIIKDEDVTINEEKLKNYYNKYQKHFENKEEVNSIHYVVFDFKQSDADKQEEEHALSEVFQNFKDAEDPVSFAESNTDGKSHDVLKKYNNEKDIPDELKNMKVGDTMIVKSHDVFERNKIYKFLSKKVKETKDSKVKGKNTKEKDVKEKAKESFEYEYVVLEQDKVFSGETKNAILNSTKEIKKCKTIEQFDKFAEDHGLTLKKVDVKVTDTSIDEVSKVRDFIHWVFFHGGNSCKDVSDAFETDKGFLVGFVEKCKKKGPKPFDEVRDIILKKVLLKEKYRILKEKVGTMKLEELSGSFDGQVISGEAKDLECKEQNLNDKVFVKYALFKTLNMEKGETSRLLKDENGCFIISLLDKKCTPILDADGKRTPEFLAFSEEKRKTFVDDCKKIDEKAFRADVDVKIFKDEVL